MAAFGISFPKLTLCRSTTSKTDTNTLSTTAASPSTTSTRTLSLSIKNVPSQPIHYDVSTSTVKKKSPTSIATILAIDGETKQLSKNLSVFNELNLDDDINEKRRSEENSSNVFIPSSLSPMGTIDHRSDIRFLAKIDSKKVVHHVKDEEKNSVEERRSSDTFSPPTSSLSPDSSSTSLDLPQLKYAIEKFLVEDRDDPVYQLAEEFSSAYFLLQHDHNGNAHSSHVAKSDVKEQQRDQIDKIEVPSLHEKNLHTSPMSKSLKWYVSELRINRPLIYRTQWTNGQQRCSNRKLSHSVNDLKQIDQMTQCQEKNNKLKRAEEITYSTFSLQNFHHHQQQKSRPQSDDNILLTQHWSSIDDDDDDDGLNHFHSDEDDQHVLPIPRTLDRSMRRDDTLIRNESVKKKLFDILNDDELENACLEDMSQEFEQMSLTPHHRELQTLNSFSSSSSDALYSSPPNELHLPLPALPPLSSSYNENLFATIHNTTERYFGRSRLITTSLDKIPMNNNASHHPSSPYLSRPSGEHIRPSWYTSPSPQWRTDDQLPLASVLKRHSSRNNDQRNGIDSNRLLSTKVTEFDTAENKYIQKYNYHHRKEQKHVSYSLTNTSRSLVGNSTTILPIIQDTSSNLLMFI